MINLSRTFGFKKNEGSGFSHSYRFVTRFGVHIFGFGVVLFFNVGTLIATVCAWLHWRPVAIFGRYCCWYLWRFKVQIKEWFWKDDFFSMVGDDVVICWLRWGCKAIEKGNWCLVQKGSIIGSHGVLFEATMAFDLSNKGDVMRYGFVCMLHVVFFSWLLN